MTTQHLTALLVVPDTNTTMQPEIAFHWPTLCEVIRVGIPRPQRPIVVSDLAEYRAATLAAVVCAAAATVRFAGAAAPGVALAPAIAGSAALAVVASLVWAFCAKTLPRFVKGEHPPPRNRVPGEWAP